MGCSKARFKADEDDVEECGLEGVLRVEEGCDLALFGFFFPDNCFPGGVGFVSMNVQSCINVE